MSPIERAESIVIGPMKRAARDLEDLLAVHIGAVQREAEAKNDSLLDMLEELLSVTEDKMSADNESEHDSENYKRWQVISAKVADLRDGEDV